MRKICVVTGTRAEYGLLYHLMKELDKDGDLKFQLVVTGAHLSPEFGLTYQVIEKDGFKIDDKVEMLLSSDSEVGTAKSVGLGVIGFADVFARLTPDIVILLGDRYEALAAAEAAMIMRIPIAHCHGGETTEGAIDEAIRHSITKMAQLHFVSEPEYRDRVIQLGENPARVFEVGALGIDHIVRMEYLTLPQLEKTLDFLLTDKFFLVTYHPVTLKNREEQEDMAALFEALECFPEYHVLFTKANSDAGGIRINHMIDAYAKAHSARVKSVVSLGQLRYLSAMNHCAAVIGNSSSGLLEAPVMRVPTVDIGDRQKGRKRADSVLHCDTESESIVQAIRQAVSMHLENRTFPHADGKIAYHIKEILKKTDLTDICMKQFYDLPRGK